jgi:UDP-N-acetylmuramyl pentapeptide synthase
VRVTNLQHSFDGAQVALSLKLTYGGSFVPVRMEGAAGKAQGYATAVGAVVGLVFGMNLVKIAESLMKYRTPAGRFSIVRGIRQSVLVDDTYNASPVAVEEALATLKTLRAKRKIAVLGDMLELGKYTLESHEQAGRLASQVVDMLVTVGLRGKFIAEAAIRAGLSRRRVYPCMHLSDAVDYLQEHLRPGDLVLLKASQGVRLEKVVYELMAEPERAGELLVRQNEEWKAKSGLYDEPR